MTGRGLVVAILALTFSAGAAGSAAGPQLQDPGALALRASRGDRSVLTEGSPPQKESVQSAHELLEAYFGTPFTAVRTEMKGAAPVVSGLIVTLPDPVRSRFAQAFDDHFGALQRALETAGYVLDRFDFPWISGTTPRAINDVPGVMLFRGSDRHTLLVVWIIGETPTAGVDKKAFIRALREYSELVGIPGGPPKGRVDCDADKKNDTIRPGTQRPIPVLGPTFSGAAASLELVIQAWQKCHKRGSPFRIVSGSATAIQPAGVCRSDASGRDEHRAYTLAGHPFAATVARDADALEAFLGFIDATGTTRDRVALLTEANTQYGRSFAGDGGTCESAVNDRRRPRVVPFPLHIAQLRAKSKASMDAAPTRTEGEMLSGLQLHAPQADVDVPAPHASNADAPAEVLLNGALQQLHTAHIRYVGIMASDVQDTILLARQVRTHVPNAMLFTLNHELLYVHADANPALSGTLVISSYPLASDNRRLTFPFMSDVGPSTFSTDRSVGVYNATLILIGRSDLLTEYGTPLAKEATRPPHWLTIVGRNGFWPLRVFEADTRKGDGYLVDARGEPLTATEADASDTVELAAVDPPHSFYLFVIAWSSACLLLGHAMGIKWNGSLTGDRGRFRLLLARPRLARHVYIAVALIVIWNVQALTGAVMLLPFHAWLANVVDVHPGENWGTWVMTATAMLIVVVTLVLVPLALGNALVAMWRVRRQRHRLAPLSMAGVCVLGPASMLLTAWVIVDWGRQPFIEQILLAVRGASLTSSVSPLTPIFCMAAAAICASSAGLRRLALLDERLPVLRVPPAIGFVQEGERQMWNMFTVEPARVPVFVVLFLVVAVPCFGLFFTGFAPPPEVRSYATFFSLAFAAVYLGLLTELFRFVHAWSAMREHLRRLAWHPAGSAFQSLREVSPPLPSLSLTHTSHPMTALTFLTGQTRSLIAALAAAPPARGAFLIAQLQRLQKSSDALLAQAATADARFESSLGSRLRRRAGATLDRICAEVTNADSALLASVTTLAANTFNARAVVLIHIGLKQLQSLIGFVTIGLLLMLFAVSMYPLQPHGWLLFFNWFVISGTVAVALIVFIQMDRDRVMSNLTNTTPGAVTFDREFWLRLMLFVIVPILSLFGANFPDVFRDLLQRLGAPSA